MDPTIILDLLKEIDSQWAAFCGKAARLAPRFMAVTGEDDLDAAMEELLELWQEYPLLWMLLLNQGESKRPPAPNAAPKFNPKETANKYYSLLTTLKSTEPPPVKANDPRSNA
jgi:hypothetical protein